MQVEKPKAPKMRSMDCIQLLKSINSKQELDQKGQEILRVLHEDRITIAENYPNILIELIQKACKLIDSEYYEDIVKVAPHGSEDTPLKYLLELLNDEDCRKILMENQSKLLSLIQIIASYGDVQFRTVCLETIIFDRGFSTGGVLHFEWSEEYLSTLKELLDKGADPTWIPPQLDWKRERLLTAQTQFFLKIFLILWEKNELYESILQVLPLMLSKKCTNNELLRGNILHEFVWPRWDHIATNRELMPPNIFHQFKKILREILKHDETLVVQKDCNGQTPLQYFLIGIKLDESIFSDVREIIQMLQSPEVLTAVNDNGYNVLFNLASQFPILQGPVTQSGWESLLELVKSFANESNVVCQNKYGYTALHPLAIKFPSEISEQSRLFYLNFIKHLAIFNILEKKDIFGCTVLHLLAYTFTFEIPDWAMETFVEVIKCLAIPSNIFIEDDNELTAWEIISIRYFHQVPEHYKDKFKEIIDILKGN